MKKSTFAIIFLFFINLGFSQTNDDNYKSLLTEYLNVQGSLTTFDATFSQMINMFGAKLDEEKYNEFKTEMITSLVAKMEDWDYSSFKDYTGLRKGTLPEIVFCKEKNNIAINQKSCMMKVMM